MTLSEIKAKVLQGDLLQDEKMELADELGKLCWEIGMLWDKLENTNPNKGGPKRYGTPNKQSMTYKLRKAARYTYP